MFSVLFVLHVPRPISAVAVVHFLNIRVSKGNCFHTKYEPDNNKPREAYKEEEQLREQTTQAERMQRGEDECTMAATNTGR